MIKTLFVAFIFMFSVQQALAHVELEVSSSTYELRGLTLKAIHEDMDMKAQEGDEIVEGETKDTFAFELNFDQTGNVCRVSTDKILLKLDIRLPRWADEENANPSVRAGWNSYFGKLKAHEDGHKTIAVAAAHKINELVHSAKGARSCAAMETSLRSSAKQIVEAAEREQEQFDASEAPFALD
ncbi:MAG: hypothetical protein BGN87_03490 [Rhizobiales bacterium 65-79]|nr:DUF922 domain-containing protein [Hyphomicrobiales bacterium]OJU04842.1 MAG: hypothetical protein BGN87_03490 [Rhizobiales bacterium 65-79]